MAVASSGLGLPFSMDNFEFDSARILAAANRAANRREELERALSTSFLDFPTTSLRVSTTSLQTFQIIGEEGKTRGAKDRPAKPLLDLRKAVGEGEVKQARSAIPHPAHPAPAHPPSVESLPTSPITPPRSAFKEEAVTPQYTVHTTVNLFDAHWSSTKEDYVNLKVNEYSLYLALQEYNEKFQSSIDYEKNFGFVEKRDIPQSKIFVRADLHGDLKSLMENLKFLVSRGILNRDYRCLPNTHLVFLGDYMDRGKYCLQVVELLARLKLENPEQVHLIRGNHEYLLMNKLFGDESVERYLTKHSAQIDKFYQTMPLALFFAQQTKTATGKHYVAFAHGALDHTTDLSSILDSDKAYATMAIPKERCFSERVKLLANIAIANGAQSRLEALLKDPNASKHAIRVCQQQAAALKIFTLPVCKDKVFTPFNWGDMKEVTSTAEIKGRKWSISPNDLRRIFKISSDRNELKILLRGHGHFYIHGAYKKKVVSSTLSIGPDCEPFKPLKLTDVCYILDTAEKISDWKKQVLRRDCGSSISALYGGAGVSLLSKEI